MVPRFECRSTRWRTPQSLVAAVRLTWGRISLDPCTEPSNPVGADRWVCPPEDGRSVEWEDRTWCNPPFGAELPTWIGKAAAEANRGLRIGLLLSVSRTETETFHEKLFRHPCLSCILFHRGKLRHSEAGPAMLASWTFWFGTDPALVERYHGHAGTVIGVGK